MTERHLQLVHQAAEAWNANDWEAMREQNRADVQISAPPDWPEAGPLRGWDAVRAQYERLKDSWSEEQVTILDLEELSDGVVVCHLRWVAQGKTSGLEMDQELWNLYVYEGDKIALVAFNFEREAAMRAAAEL